MKQVRYMLASVAAIFIVLVVATSASAAGFFVGSEDGNAILATGREVDGSAFMAGTEVVVEGTIKGDLYCAGETVTIKGVVEGDVICAGATVDITGAVTGDIRVAGATVNLAGATKGSVLVGGSNIKTSKDFTLGGDFTAGGETLELDGSFGRDILVGASNLTLRGQVVRDASLGFESANVEQTTKIGGDLWYKAPQQTGIPAGIVAGSTHFEQGEVTESAGFDLGSAFVGTIGLILLTVVSVLIAPRFVHTAASLTPRETLLTFLAGLATVIFLPIVAIVVLVTVVGAWLGFVLLLMWLLLMLLAFVFAAYYVGGLVLQKRATNALLVGVVGALVLSVALWIPVINVLVFISALCIGTGMQVMHLKYQFSKDPYKIV